MLRRFAVALCCVLIAPPLSVARAQTPVSPPPAAPAAAPQQPAAQPPAPSQQTTPNAAQPTRNPDGTYTIRTNSRLVILDAVVTDAKGHAIQGLTKSDFNVTEQGEPQSILRFEVSGTRVPDPAQDIESTADLDRVAPNAPVNIILLDEFNTRFEDMAFARYSLKKFLERQPDHLTTPTMLIAVSLGKFEVLRDYTQNKQLLIDALDHHFVALPWRSTSASWAGERLGTAFLTLRRVSEAVIGHPGHKNMIWIGRGLPALNMANVPVDTSNRIDNAVQECVNSLRDARVTLTTIDPAGLLVDQNAYGEDAKLNDPFGGNYEFAKLARATGGRAIYGRNDVDTQIGAAVEDGTHFYTLTYRPSNDSADASKFRKIKVTVDRPDAVVTTREGYYLATRPGRVNPAAPGRRLVADLMSADTSTMAYDGVDMALLPIAGQPGNWTLHIAARSLAWTVATDTTPRQAEVILMVSSFDKKGKELKRDARDLKASAPADVPPSGRIERALNIPYKLDLDPKAVRVRFVVRLAWNGRIGTQDVDLTKPWPTQPVAESPATP